MGKARIRQLPHRRIMVTLGEMADENNPHLPGAMDADVHHTNDEGAVQRGHAQVTGGGLPDCTGGQHPTSAHGVTLCGRCADDLARDLRAVAGVWADIRISAEKRDVGAGTVGSSGHKAPQEVANLDAVEHGDQLRAVLNGWASELMGSPVRTRPPSAAALLLKSLAEVRRREWAGDLKDELSAALRQCRAATDRHPETIALGACWDCDTGTMTALAGETRAHCGECGAVGDAKDRQRWMIMTATNATAHLSVVLSWLKMSGHAKIRQTTADTWVKRGRLDAAGFDPETGRKLYTPAAVLKAYAGTPTGRRDTTQRNLV